MAPRVVLDERNNNVQLDRAEKVAGPSAAWVPRKTYSTASHSTLKHSHLKKHTAVARATAGKVLANRCARHAGTEHPPRAILAAHEVKHLDHLVSHSSYRVKLLLQLPKRVPAPSFSTGLALSSV